MSTGVQSRVGRAGWTGMNRRRCLAGLLLWAWRPLLLAAELPRIGVLLTGLASEPNNVVFTEALRELGYTVGKNVLIERRFAGGRAERLPALAAELVQLNVNVIYTSGTGPAVAAKQAAGGITPIVFVNVADPIGSGLVTSLRRPGTNITGTAVIAHELAAKRLELLHLALPGLKRVAVMSSNESVAQTQLSKVEQAARSLGLALMQFELRAREEFDEHLNRLRRWKAQALYVIETPRNFFHRELIGEFARQTGLISIGGTREYARAGLLMSYGSDYEENYRRAAIYVDKILRGVKPADLPVEQPMRMRLVVNADVAASLGFAMPLEIILCADETIK